MKKDVAAAMIWENDKLLICQRAADDELGLMWEFPGGKREGEETIEECIIREIKEELELDIEVLDVFTTSIYYFGGNEVHFTVFNSKIKGGKMKLNVHNDARWITVDQLGLYEFMPPDVVFVEKLKKHYS